MSVRHPRSLRAGQVEVLVSSDASECIEFSAPGVHDLAIGLPFAEDALLVGSADQPYFDNGNGSSTVPLVKDDGSVQILTTIESANAPSRYDYALGIEEGAILALTSNGGAEVINSDGSVNTTIAPPWAVDANGAAVPTHYLIAGDTLIQVVDFDSSTAFPVVADPSFSLGWAVYVKYIKAEVKRLAPSSLGATTAKAINAAVCGIIGAALTVSASTFNSAKKNGKCVEMQYAYISGVPLSWKPYSC